jgi:RNA polymerase sigma-70 factor (ECF subfamily)
MTDVFRETLSGALADVIGQLPCHQLEAADPMVRRLVASAGYTLPSILAELADEILAVAVQKNFLRKLAFEELMVHRHEKALRRWFFRHTGNWTLVEDLTQDLYLKLLAKNTLAGYNPDYPFGPWLWKVVYNLWVGEWRRTRKQVQLAEREQVDHGPSPPDEAVSRELEERLEVAVGALPPLQQRVFRGAMRGANTASLAQELGQPRERVSQLLFKARRQVERALGEGREDGAAAHRASPPGIPHLPTERVRST